MVFGGLVVCGSSGAAVLLLGRSGRGRGRDSRVLFGASGSWLVCTNGWFGEFAHLVLERFFGLDFFSYPFAPRFKVDKLEMKLVFSVF